MLSDELIREKIVRLLEEAYVGGRPLDVGEVADHVAVLVDLPLPVIVHHVKTIAERLGIAGYRH